MRWILDVGAVVLLVVNVALGLRYGVVGRVIALAGVYSGVAAATFAGNGVARAVAGKNSPDDLYHAGWSFVIVFAVVVAMFEIIGALYRDKISAVVSLAFERAGGVVLALGVAFLEFAVVSMVLLAIGNASAGLGESVPPDRGKASDAVHDSTFGSAVSRADDQVHSFFSAVLPSDLASHLTEATQP